MTLERRHVGKRLSELVIHRASGLCWLAGQVADDPKADVTGQTRQVLAQIDRLLAEAGSDKSRLLSAQIFLADMADFAAMNKVWEGWVVPGQTPARATVQAAMAAPDYRVEIVVTAASA
jgi:enamine deaminase RidA (YjgF/YER057c/UK114 family)